MMNSTFLSASKVFFRLLIEMMTFLMSFFIQFLRFFIDVFAVSVDIFVHITNVLSDVFRNVSFGGRDAHMSNQGCSKQ